MFNETCVQSGIIHSQNAAITLYAQKVSFHMKDTVGYSLNQNWIRIGNLFVI